MKKNGLIFSKRSKHILSFFCLLPNRALFKNVNGVNISLVLTRLVSVLKFFFHQCVISSTCSQSTYNGSVIKQSPQSKTGYKYMI